MVKKCVGLFALFFFIASCAINPVTGKRELSLISEQDEIALGQQTDGQIQSQFGIYDDASIESYVRTVGASLVSGTHRPNLPYKFAVLDSPVVNAFAVPGGYIYVTRGILALMNSEAELAAVLGHELGHVNARHSVRRMSEMQLAQLGLAVGSAVSEKFARLSGIAGIGMQLLFLKFSRSDEREADALGIAYSRSAGYDPGGIIPFFGALEKMGDLSGGQSLPGFLSTHPLTSERIQNAKNMMEPGDTSLAKRPETYLKNIDNMVFGEDPRQGFVESGVFYHPLMRFQFSVPSGWKLQNMATQVTLISQDGNGAMLFQAERSQENLRDFARRKAASFKDGQLQGERSISVNGLSGYEHSFTIPQAENQTLGLRQSFIRKGDMVYTFSALSAAQNFSQYANTFQGISRSFRQLTDQSKLNRLPKRVDLVQANGSRTLQDIFKRAGMPEKSWPNFAIMNGLDVKSVPPRGRWIKIVR
jgi:predicted Zn-dependent protease